MWEAFNTNGTSPRTEVYYGTTELYVGAHGPAIRDAAGWKLIVNGGGGVGGWDMKPGSGGVPDTPPGAKLGVCGEMMDTYEGTCIPHDGLGRYPTNSTAECCDHCLATRGCFSWVVRHDEGVCYINQNDVQEGTSVPPIWPSSHGPCTYAAVSVRTQAQTPQLAFSTDISDGLLVVSGARRDRQQIAQLVQRRGG